MPALPTMPAPSALPGLLAFTTRLTTRFTASLRPSLPPPTPATAAARTFSSTSPVAAVPVRRNIPGMPTGGGMSRAKRMQADRDPKIKILDKAMYKLQFVPPPLRMARNRYLRHWTIHRAWLLLRRQRREQRERELMQQYQSMANACEELRLSRGPGLRDEGYLFRVAMEKKGVYRHGGIPIEYARPQTETPARIAWNHDWKR